MFHAEFELTNNCNTRCLHCPHEVMSRPKGRLEWSTYQTVTGKIRDHVQGTGYSLSFSGMGEPLLHPEIFRFVKHVSHEARTSFASNGAALTEDNVRRLIDAGLDQIYFSFNGDEPEIYERMMGGLKFDRALRNLRNARALTEGTRLKISANISVTKANRHRLTAITELLEREGVTQPSYAMAHTRGGNITDPEVIDTPPISAEVTHCEVLKNTLFIDWRGKVMICDHDLHGEYVLGDLVVEPFSVVHERRQKLVEEGMNFKICHVCSDVLKMGTDLFADIRSGTLRDWIYDVYKTVENDAVLPDASHNQRWLYSLYQKENRPDRMVNGLLKRNKVMEAVFAEREAHAANMETLASKRAEIIETLNVGARGLAHRINELDGLTKERERRVLQLEAERKRQNEFWTSKLVRMESWLRRKLSKSPGATRGNA